MPNADRRTIMKLGLRGTGAALAVPALGRERKGSASPVDFDHLTVRRLPTAEVELVDASYFLLETHGAFAAHRLGRFLPSALG